MLLHLFLAAWLLLSAHSAGCSSSSCCTSTSRSLLQKAEGELQASATYPDIWTAVTTESAFVKELASGALNGPNSAVMWSTQWNRDISSLMVMATSPNLKATAFFVGPSDAYTVQAAAQCLTLREWFNVLLNHTSMTAEYFKVSVVLGKALHSSNFTEGMELRTMQNSVRLTLGERKINGTMHWVFRNASAYRIPGTQYDYEDIALIPSRMNIKAGAAWLHLIDKPIRIDQYQPFWAEKRAEVLEKAGLPANSTTCPDSSGSGSLEKKRLAIGVAIGGACFVGIVSAALLICRRKAHTGRWCPKSQSGSGLCGLLPVASKADSARNGSATPPDGGPQQLGAPCSSSASGFGSSPFAMFLHGGHNPSALAALNQPSTIGTGNGTMPSQRQSKSGGQPPSGSRSTDGSSQTADRSSGDKLAPLPGQRSPRNRGDADNSYEGGLLATDSAPIGQIPHALVVPYEELSLDEMIGKGAEGKVYRGTWKHTDIAAKEYLPRLPASSDKDSQDTASSEARAVAAAQTALAKEVYFLTRLNHPNLVRFCAVCLERPLLVMEYCKNGSVFDIIRKAETELASTPDALQDAQQCCQYLSWDRRLMMLHNVAAGMSYLHGRDHIHGDLRSTNLFVGADGMVKIGDFGFTKRLARDSPSMKVARITHPRWVAPELLLMNTLSAASDVFSFGVIMYELLTFRVPFEGLRKEQVVLEVMRGARPQIPDEEALPPGTSSSTCLWSYVRLMEACWAQDPAARPTFEAIARRIKAMQRWRKVISTFRPVHTPAERPHPAQPGADAFTPFVAEQIDDQGAPPARRVSSAPTSVQQHHMPLNGGALDLQFPASPHHGHQQQQPPPPSVLRSPFAAQPGGKPLQAAPPSAEVLLHAGAGADAHSPFACPGAADMVSSLCSAVVHGKRLAIIATSPAADEADALASVADPAQIAEARVLLVTSDLPSQYESLTSPGSGRLECQPAT